MKQKNPRSDLATRVALLYYSDNLSQNDIALTLGISRSYVSQLLTLARELGIVQITVNAGEAYLAEESFARRYQLQQAFILPSTSQEYTDSEFGKYCAPHTLRLIRNVKRIGINLGASVNKVVSMIQKEDVGDCTVELVAQIMGGCVQQEKTKAGSMPSELVFRMGQLLNCDTLYLNCPALITNATARELLLQEASIQNVIAAWDHLDMVLMGMGQAGAGMLFGNFPELRARIRASRAVADVNLNFLDRSGALLPVLVENRMAMAFEDIRKVKTKVAYAYGTPKAKAILAAMRAKMIDVLFTDSLTMDEILKLDK